MPTGLRPARVLDVITVRPALPADFERIGDITVAAYALPGDVDYVDFLRNTADRAVPPTEIWVAELDGVVVGSVTWCPPGSIHREVAGPDDGEFRTLAVDPAAQGHGVGAALFRAIVDRARADGLSGIALTTASWMTTAHGLYERAGFVRTPTLDWTAGDIVLLTYRLDLAPEWPTQPP